MRDLYESEKVIVPGGTGMLPCPEIETWSTLAEYQTWIVFEATIGSTTFWAWNRVGGGVPDISGPYFLETWYTTPDGREAADLEQAPSILGRFLFQIQLPVEPT